MEIHKRLSEIRRMKKIPQWKVAEKLQLTQSAYNKIEKGATELNLNKLFDICSALDVKPIEMLFPEHLSDSKSELSQNSRLSQLQDHYIEVIKLRDNIIQELKIRTEILQTIADDYKSLFKEAKTTIESLKKEIAGLKEKQKR